MNNAANIASEAIAATVLATGFNTGIALCDRER